MKGYFFMRGWRSGACKHKIVVPCFFNLPCLKRLSDKKCISDRKWEFLYFKKSSSFFFMINSVLNYINDRIMKNVNVKSSFG